MFKAYFCEIYYTVKLAKCKAYTQYCALHPGDTCLYQILQKSPRMPPYTICHSKLCVKDKPPGLTSLCVNKLHEKISVIIITSA